MKLGHTKYTFIVLFILITTFFAGATIFSSFITPASAETASPKVSTIDPSAYSVSISSDPGIVNLQLETVPYVNTIRSGKDTVKTNITAPDNTQSKFQLYLSTNGNSNSLQNANTSDTIPATTGTLESPAPLTSNSWGFALANTTPGLPTPNGFDETYTVGDPGKNSKWAAVPAKGHEQLIQKDLSMNQSSTSTDVYYAVSARDNLADGNYTGTIVYTAIYEAAETLEATLSRTEGTAGNDITITTAAKTDMDVSDLGTATVNFTSSTSTPCSNPTLSKTSEGLIQVSCQVPELPAAGNYTVTVTLDKNGQTYTSTQTFAYTLPGPTPEPAGCTTPMPDGKIYMQDITESTKSEMVQNTEYVLTDKRDGKSYCVSKLQDGHIWMTDNLRLNLSNSTTLKPADTDITEDWTPLKSTVTTASEYTGSSIEPRSFDPRDEYIYNSGSTANDPIYTSLSDCTNAGHTETECRHYYTGVLYNFPASVASNNVTATSGDIDTSICPAGWKLPSAGRTNPSDFGTMLFEQGIIPQTTAQGSTTSYVAPAATSFNNLRASGPHWSRAGYIEGGSRSNRGIQGYYWSRTTNNSSTAYNGDFNSSRINPRNYGSRERGRSVRCLYE